MVVSVPSESGRVLHMPERSSMDLPYCGMPPVPADIWRNWNLDPVLLTVLAVVALAYGGALRSRFKLPHQPIGRMESASFHAGWLVLTLALVSPLCSLSVALFSARVGQHMLLALVAAPLIVLGRPQIALGRLWLAWRAGRSGEPGRAAGGSTGQSDRRRNSGAAVACVLFGAFLWLWHMPAAYAATFSSDFIYWAMHLTLFGSALLLWQVLLRPDRSALAKRLLVGFATLMQMSLLGALITFAPRLLYGSHVLTTQVWGLTPLEDQQLGGLIMWVPGCSVVLLAMLGAVARLLDPERPQEGALPSTPRDSLSHTSR